MIVNPDVEGCNKTLRKHSIKLSKNAKKQPTENQIYTKYRSRR